MRDGSTNLFTVRRNKNPEVCPIKAIDLYVAFAKGIPMGSFIQFRSTFPGGEIVDKPFSTSFPGLRKALGTRLNPFHTPMQILASR